MGSGASVENEPQCPYHRMRQAEVKKAQSTHYIDGEASDFYFHCANGNVDEVRKILEDPVPQPIDELVKRERNGDTALHVAVEKGHVEIVELLLEHGCSLIILNRFGKMASEVAITSQMQRLFIRSKTSERFYDSNPHRTMTMYLPEATLPEVTSPEATKNETQKNFVELLNTEEDVQTYSLNHQTTAMWVKLFNWLVRNFPSYFERDNLNLSTFHLHRNPDFHQFLGKKIKEGKLDNKTIQEIQKAAHAENSIEKLIFLYTRNDLGFYESLNQQLADSPNEADTSPHLCDRFIIEFHLRGDDLKKRRYTGTVYRGATMKSNALSIYEQALEKKPRGIILFNSFTSTSYDKDVPLDFLSEGPLGNDQINILFVIKIKTKTPTIIGIADVSKFPDEKEVLIMPGNLFVVKNLVKGVTVRARDQRSIELTEIHLEYLHTPVSLWRKLLHTYRSAANTVT